MISPDTLKDMTLANMGLNAYTGYQQGQARERDYNRMEEAQKYIDNPYLAYQNDPALLAARRRRLQTLRQGYLAKYGGTEGGAFAKELMRVGSEFDATAGQSKYNQLAQIYGPGAQAYSQAGGMSGIMGSTAGNALRDYTTYQLLMSSLGGGK
jgi:hypothetical protein